MSRDGAVAAARRLWRLLPALVAALLVVRVAEFTGALPAGTAPAAVAGSAALALLADALAFAALLPLAVLLGWPGASRGTPRAGGLLVAAGWTVLLLAHAGLSRYFVATRLPLGADLFAYSRDEIAVAAASGGSSLAATVLGVGLPLLVLWAMVAWRAPAAWRASARPMPKGSAWWIPAAVVAGAWLSAQLVAPGRLDDARADLVRNKSLHFVQDGLAYAWASQAGAPTDIGTAAVRSGMAYGEIDPAYPFLRVEQSPDVLGPFFRKAERPPSIVLVVVEGLGRSFSGPDAALGSFTPFLDALAARSLSFDNFLAPQGRTFGVMPSILGSLPFGRQGFAELGDAMPPHASVPGVLSAQGYAVSFHAGFDPAFDNEGPLLLRQGVDRIVGSGDFGPEFPRMPGALSWGYADGVLVDKVLSDLPTFRAPFLAIVQTVGMHTPYEVPDQAAWDARVEARLDTLGIPDAARASYRQFRAQYASILYADDALRRLHEGFSRHPDFADTVFVITGDHRLPEIPLTSRLDRYHVPLVIASPLLEAPARIRAVSSQFDLAPSLLAWLADDYGLRTPRRVAWLGTGLDMATSFRNHHDIPLMQTKTDLRDFVSGAWFLGNGRLHAITDGMAIEAVEDPAALAEVTARFDRFRAANAAFARSGTLMPDAAPGDLAAYGDSPRLPVAAESSADVALAVRSVRVERTEGGLRLAAAFENAGRLPSPAFVPLAVIVDGAGQELAESYGPATRLAAGEVREVVMPLRHAGVAPGHYFLAVLPSDPETGKRVGAGRFRVPVEIPGGDAPPP